FDSIARYGGEEFVVVMPGSSPADARLAAERLRSSIEEMPFQAAPGVMHRITVSIGVAYSERRETTPEQILQAADVAMYRAKHAGRNRVEFAEEFDGKSA